MRAAFSSGLRKYSRVTLGPRHSSWPMTPGSTGFSALSTARSSVCGNARPTASSRPAMTSVVRAAPDALCSVMPQMLMGFHPRPIMSAASCSSHGAPPTRAFVNREVSIGRPDCAACRTSRTSIRYMVGTANIIWTRYFSIAARTAAESNFSKMTTVPPWEKISVVVPLNPPICDRGAVTASTVAGEYSNTSRKFVQPHHMFL